MVLFFTFPPVEHLTLSVLALSSRFDGQACWLVGSCSPVLSVLALSSRFDGQT